MTQDEKIQAAKKAGYSDAEISDFLGGATAPKAAAAPAAPEERGLLAAMKDAFKRGILEQPYDIDANSFFPAPRDAEEGVKMSKGLIKVAPNAARYGIPMLQPEGGPGGAAAGGGGEALAQLMESGKITDPGAIASSSAVNAIPLGKTKTIYDVLKNSAKVAAGGAAAPQIRSLVNDQKFAPASESGKGAAIGAVIPVGLKAVEKVVGATVGRGALREANAAENPMAEANRNAAPMVEEGARVIPSKQNPTLKNKIMDTLANPGEIAKATEIPNALTNLKMSLRAIGAKEGEFATPEVLEKAKAPAQAVYNEITQLGEQGRNMSAAEQAARGRVEGAHGAALQDSWAANQIPEVQAQAGVDLKAFQEARDKVAAIRSAMDTKLAATDSAGTPINLQKMHDAAEAEAEQLKQKIIDGLKAIKRGDLADKFNFAQKRFAQVGEVERWANFNTGTVDPSKAFNVQNKTGKLTDELKTVADFRGAVGPSIDKELSRVSSIPGRMSRFGPTATAATVGTLTGGPQAGAGAASLVELMRYAALKHQLSDAVQKASVGPRMVRGPSDDISLAPLLRYAAIRASLQPQE